MNGSTEWVRMLLVGTAIAVAIPLLLGILSVALYYGIEAVGG